ncbi:MAG: threonine synthase [Steroidobacteraceae bacterium]|nr:threonine synthase [Steroidobacteraceae bacterium]
MLFSSTRNLATKVGLSKALSDGIAPDGGLYVPERFPALQVGDFEGVSGLAAIAERFLAPFFSSDPLGPHLADIAADAFNFPAPVKRVSVAGGKLSVLELFHGPTAAFKDFGARFLAACLSRIPRADSRPLTILVATSGDTGGAVAAAFHKRPGVRVVVLYPEGLVSPLQEHQLNCWGDNVSSIAVRGNFDDCQRMVKQAFADRTLAHAMQLSSANSINVGRLLPQAAYYAASSLDLWRAEGACPGYVIPSGNLGNVLACLWARRSGLPVGEVVLAHNANRAVVEFLATGEWQPRPSVATLASAMDVGNPSNMERLRVLHPEWRDLAVQVSAYSVDDDAIRTRIAGDFTVLGETWCPHTATAAEVYARLPADSRRALHWVLVATAHAAKFREIVEPLIGEEVELPPALAGLLALPAHHDTLPAELDALRDYLLALRNP